MKLKDHAPPTDTPILLAKTQPRPVTPALESPARQALAVGPCVDLGRSFRPCYGPRGLPKSLLFRFPHGYSGQPVSSPDTASALSHMGLEDPQALALVSAASAQAREHGDGAALVLLLASSLLSQAGDLLALGVTGAEIQAGYRQACGRALGLLEGMGCGHLEEPREEIQVRGFLRDFLASWQPGFESLLEEVAARSCVHSWRPLVSGAGGEVWEGVTFDPSCVSVRTALEREKAAQGLETEDGGMEGGGEKAKDTTEEEGEENKKEESKEEEMMSTREEEGQVIEKEGQAEQEEKMEGTTGSNEEKESDEILQEKETEDQDNKREQGEKEDAKTEKEDEETRNGEVERGSKERVEDKASEDWLDMSAEILAREEEEREEEWVVWTDEPDETERKTREATRTEGTPGDPLSIKIHGSISKLLERCSTERQMHKHIASVRSASAQRKRRLHRPKCRLSGPASRPAGCHDYRHPGKIHRSPRRAHPATDPLKSLSLQASVLVEEPVDEKACPKVTVTLRSPDQTLLESAQGAVAASLRVYRSLLMDPRVVPGAGASEAGLARGLTLYGLSLVGMEQLAVHAFAQALLEPVKALGENAGTPGDLAVLRRYGEHWGCRGEEAEDVEAPGPGGRVVDGLGCKSSAIQKATQATLTILNDLVSYPQ